MAIISKDQGFHAVRDYWDMRLPSNKKMILSPSIERSLIASNDNSERVKRLKNKLNGIDINVFQAKYEERRRLQEVLTEIFGETIFADRLSEIQDLLENGENKKIIYLSSLHRFGRKQGLEVYDRLKPILYQEA